MSETAPAPPSPGRRPLVAVLLLGAALGGTGITWGLPSMLGWAADELTPVRVLSGMRQRFAGGWHDAYPPFHFYVLAGAYAPVLAADSRPLADVAQEGWRRRPGDGAWLALFLAGRLVSLAMALGILAAVHAAGRTLFDHGAAAWAAVLVALSLPFVYYAKVANVDIAFTFWFALAFLGYVRALREGRLRDGLLFAVCAALSVCAKDQAYGLFVLPAAHLLAAHARRARSRPWPARVMGAPVLACAAAAAGVFLLADGVLFNTSGFRAHLEVLTGPMNRSLQMFERTLGGYVAATALAGRLLAFCLGVPALFACAAGLAVAWRSGERRAAAAVILPCLSYLVFFLWAALVVYDRYLMPLVAVLSLLGGRFFSFALARRGRVRYAGLALAALAVSVGLARALAVDLAMARDGRYAAEEWMARHVPAAASVAISGPLAHLPRLHAYRWTQHASLGGTAADVVVLTSDRARAARERAGEPAFVDETARGLGYDVVYRHRSRFAWPLDLGWWIGGVEPCTNLHKVDPEVAVLARPGYLPSSSSRSLPGTTAALPSTSSRIAFRR